jgi:hypothetical protein
MHLQARIRVSQQLGRKDGFALHPFQKQVFSHAEKAAYH